MGLKSIKIGGLKLKNNLFLAPMVDVTDLPYREICRDCGAGMAYTEMLYISAILHENTKTLNLMKTNKKDSPLGLQITGNSEREFEELIKRKSLLKNYDLIDINCGCPSLRITGNSAGSYLLRNPDKIANMVRILKKTGKPVSVKIRMGFKKNNVLEVAKIVEKAGADAITVHARLAVQGRNVPADWKWIKKVKGLVSVPVIGNGDVFSGKDAEKMLKETGCDGVMIARGAIGDPLIFSRILAYLENGKMGEKEGEIDRRENLKLFKKYLILEKKYYKSDVDLGRVKYIGGRFIRGFRGAGKMRNEFVKLKTLDEIEEFVNDISIESGKFK